MLYATGSWEVQGIQVNLCVLLEKPDITYPSQTLNMESLEPSAELVRILGHAENTFGTGETISANL